MRLHAAEQLQADVLRVAGLSPLKGRLQESGIHRPDIPRKRH